MTMAEIKLAVPHRWEARNPGADDRWCLHCGYGPEHTIHIGRFTEPMPGTPPDLSRVDNARARLLDEAKATVTGARQDEYSGPEQSFERIATLWNVWLTERLDLADTRPLVAEDVAVMMILMKTARLMTTIDHHDSVVDIAGYAACLAEIVE